MAREVGDPIARTRLVVGEDVQQARVEALEEDVEVRLADAEVHIVAQAEGVRDLGTEVISVHHLLCLPIDYPYV